MIQFFSGRENCLVCSTLADLTDVSKTARLMFDDHLGI